MVTGTHVPGATRTTSRLWPAAVIVVSIVVLSLLTTVFLSAQSTSADAARDRITLGVPGQASAAAQVASVEDTVALVWGTRAPGSSVGDVVLAISHDAGRTFGSPRRVNSGASDVEVGGEQPPHVVLRSPEELFVVWRAVRGKQAIITAAYSSDGGRSFTEATPLHELSAPAFRGFQSAAVGAMGPSMSRGWTEGHADGPTRQPHGAPRQDLFHASWAPGRVPVETQVVEDVCFCCKTATTVADDGSVFLAWRHIYPGSFRDIAFGRLADAPFTAPLPVSEDRWELNGCPDDGPSMSLDSANAVHVAWATLLPGPPPEIGLFYAMSKDAKAFTPRVRVPTLGGIDASHPRIVLNDAGGAVVWDELVNDERQVAFVRGTRDTAGRALRFQQPIRLSARGERALYPAAAAVSGAVFVAWTSGNDRDETVIAARRVLRPTTND